MGGPEEGSELAPLPRAEKQRPNVSYWYEALVNCEEDMYAWTAYAYERDG
jgi:hypothetical protein